MDYKEKIIALLNSQELSKEQKEKLESFFPELKESEDERIRKEIIAFLTYYHTGQGNSVKYDDGWIAWLKKQGEKSQGKSALESAKEEKVDNQNCAKPNDKVEPKFKVGDFIANDYCRGKVVELTNDAYLLDTGQGIPFSCEHNIHLWTIQNVMDGDKIEPKFKVGDWVTNGRYTILIVGINSDCSYYMFKDGTSKRIKDIDKKYYLWTIQDAKAGDVLCTYECDEPKIVFILKGTPKKHYALSYYCYYNIMYPHFKSDSEKGCLAPNDKDVKPATKEQCDQLEKAMADAGYTFNFEKKELRKLKFTVGDIVKSKSQPMLDARKIISIGKDCYWCEDRGCIGFAWEDDCEIVWQNHAAWSEEDEKMIEAIEALCDDKIRFTEFHDVKEHAYTVKNWLKSIRPQNRWKPSDEQLNNILDVLSFDNCTPKRRELLESLYQDLKKLREE